MKRLLLVVMLAVVLLAGSLGTAYAASTDFAPYLVPPQVPAATSPEVQTYLEGSSVTSEDGWIIVHLKGSPYQVGFQNGYLTAQSADYTIRNFYGEPGQFRRRWVDRVARAYIWPLVPAEYKQELQGIADGMKAAGYPQDHLWDVVGLNAWFDGPPYAMLLPPNDPMSAVAADLLEESKTRGGCSAFIATGDATADGRPVMGHNSWTPYSMVFTMNVMYYVDPSKGYDFTYQSFGGSIWSGVDWYENKAGLMFTETTLADSTYTLTGTPVFVRARKAAQYAATVGQAVKILLTNNNGVYSNEWLIGDASGKIASLQLGDKASDLTTTRNGFFGSSNFTWGPNVRAEQIAAGVEPRPYDPASICYARYVRWGQLRDQYYGEIDAAIGRAMISDTYDSYLNEEHPGLRCLCGEPEYDTPYLPDRDIGNVYDPNGAFDGKVATEAMVLSGLSSWACWGRGSGDHFDAAEWLEANPWWPDEWGPFALFALMTYSAQSTDQWVRLGD